MRIEMMASKRSIKMAQLYRWLQKTGHRYWGVSEGIGREGISDQNLNLIDGSEDWIDDVVRGKLQPREVHKALVENVSPYDIAAKAEARRLKQRSFECDWSLIGSVSMNAEIVDPHSSAADVRKLIHESDGLLAVLCQHGGDSADDWQIKNEAGEVIALIHMTVAASLQPRRKGSASGRADAPALGGIIPP
jgi:hypothetical protein